MSTLRVALVLALAAAGGCDRETRRWDELPARAVPTGSVPVPTLHAGLAPARPPTPNAYDENAWAVSEGQRLFTAMNCVGCHAHGGGGMGPPLMDDTWIYGWQPLNIYDTILEGRPNGMPSYRGKLADHDVWKLVAYVRSLGGLVPAGAASARDDHQLAIPSRQQADAVTPRRQEPDRP